MAANGSRTRAEAANRSARAAASHQSGFHQQSPLLMEGHYNATEATIETQFTGHGRRKKRRWKQALSFDPASKAGLAKHERQYDRSVRHRVPDNRRQTAARTATEPSILSLGPPADFQKPAEPKEHKESTVRVKTGSAVQHRRQQHKRRDNSAGSGHGVN